MLKENIKIAKMKYRCAVVGAQFATEGKRARIWRDDKTLVTCCAGFIGSLGKL